MTYTITWDEIEIDAATRFLKDDPDGLAQLMNSIDLLADEPRLSGTTWYGSADTIAVVYLGWIG